MNKIKILAIFATGIVFGISSLLFVGLVEKSGFIQFSQATTLPPPPFVCLNCRFFPSFGNRFAGVELKNAYMPGNSSSQNDYTSSNFKNAFLDSMTSSLDNFTGVKFVSAVMTSWSVSNDNFTGADFTGANMTQWSDSSDNFTNANFTNADLTTSHSFGSGDTFTGAIWSNTTCPDGTNSNSDGNTCVNNL